MSTGGIVHCGLRYELMPVSMLISTAVPYCLLLEGVELLIFTTDKASGRAAVSQGGVGKRWKNHGVFLRYSYSSGLILPLLASDTPVLALDVLRAYILRCWGPCPTPLYLTYNGKRSAGEKEERSPSQYVGTNVRGLMVS